tara:strand:+ start:205 stop:402 length:198 start_codon:yes stop_codon:yes gene_type:complete
MTTISLKQLVDMHTEVEMLFVYFESLPKPMENAAFKAQFNMINTRVTLKHLVAIATANHQIEVTE